MSFAEPLSVNHRQALQFFFGGLKDVSQGEVREDELLYNASVLAHFAQVSCDSTETIPCPRNLSQVFDNHILPNSQVGDIVSDPEVCEAVACQILLLSGFFADQMRGRHNLNWYHGEGARFFRTLSRNTSSSKRSEFFSRMSLGFPIWAERQSRLRRELSVQWYVLKI